MRICVFNWRDLRHPQAGGAEVYTHEVLRRLASDNAVTLFAAAVPGAPSYEECDGIRIVRAGSKLGVYRAARRWWRREGRGKFDLVIDEVNTRPFGCVRWVDDAHVVAFIHQVAKEVWRFETPLPVALAGRYILEPRWLRAYAERPVLTVSDSSRESLLGYGLRRVDIVPEGAPERQRTDVPREAVPTLVYVGRMSANKRPAEAIRIHSILRNSMPDVCLWMVGDGPERNRLEGEAGEGVTFFGRVSEHEKHTLMARAHALLATSVREGWGLVVDEAAAMGTPTVGYDVPGLRDSVPAARGVLVPADAPAAAEALARHLAEWVARPAVAGWRGGARSWDEVASAFLAAARGTSGGRAVPVGRRPAAEALVNTAGPTSP